MWPTETFWDKLMGLTCPIHHHSYCNTDMHLFDSAPILWLKIRNLAPNCPSFQVFSSFKHRWYVSVIRLGFWVGSKPTLKKKFYKLLAGLPSGFKKENISNTSTVLWINKFLGKSSNSLSEIIADMDSILWNCYPVSLTVYLSPRK